VKPFLTEGFRRVERLRVGNSTPNQDECDEQPASFPIVHVLIPFPRTAEAGEKF